MSLSVCIMNEKELKAMEMQESVSFDGFIFHEMKVSDIISHAKGQIAMIDPYKVREQGAEITNGGIAYFQRRGYISGEKLIMINAN